MSPNYLQISSDLQTLFSSVFANSAPSAALEALARRAATIKTAADSTELRRSAMATEIETAGRA